jgi:hypothetical protein
MIMERKRTCNDESLPLRFQPANAWYERLAKLNFIFSVGKCIKINYNTCSHMRKCRRQVTNEPKGHCGGFERWQKRRTTCCLPIVRHAPGRVGQTSLNMPNSFLILSCMHPVKFYQIYIAVGLVVLTRVFSEQVLENSHLTEHAFVAYYSTFLSNIRVKIILLIM